MLIFFITVIAVILYIYFNLDNFKIILKISFLNLIILLIISIISIYISSLQFKTVTKIFNIFLEFKEWFGLSVLNTMYNYYSPARGGTIIRAVYLKKKYYLPYSKYFALISGSYILNIFISSLSAFLLILIIKLLYDKFYQIVFWFSLVSFIFSSLLIYLLFLKFKNIIFKNKKFMGIINNIHQGLEYFKNNPFLCFKFILFQILLLFILSLRLYYSFIAIGISVNFI